MTGSTGSTGSDKAKRAVVFAGQGAQFAGMGADLAGEYRECREVFERGNEALGYDIAGICFKGPEEELKKSSVCQPAVFIVSAACWRALLVEMPGFEFTGTAGLSLGEWTALYAAGALSFEDTVKVLEARGRFMEEACFKTEGAMLSVIGLSSGKNREIAAEAGVETANFNSPQQTVLSGKVRGIEKAEKLAQAAGAKRAIRLKVAGAYHSSLMAEAAEALAETIKNVDIRSPEVPVVANVTGRPHGSPDEIRANMVKQVSNSIDWVSCVEWFRRAGTAGYLECGPGKVLTGLIRRIDRNALLYNIQDLKTLRSAVGELSPGQTEKEGTKGG
ncbi:MAG: ACP S-malonyltransferase [Kiritimatiellia bacterium]